VTGFVSVGTFGNEPAQTARGRKIDTRTALKARCGRRCIIDFIKIE
jgi:hypothetical protein